MARINARMARRRNKIDRLTLIVLIAFIVAACITAVLAFTWARSFFASKGGDEPPIVAGEQGTQTSPGIFPSVPTIDPNKPLQEPGSGPTPVPWDGSSRVTILVMGLDGRDWAETTDIPRTDTMILFSMDPVNKTAGMLSIPRDLWVNIPNMGYNKINTAYRWGELYDLPDGPSLAMRTTEEFLGVPVHYYVLVDFNAFVQFIDELGGLDMHIKEEIVVDPIGPGNTRTLEPGVQTLDGATVLAYARNRHTANDDFDRSARQQEVIMAIREQVLTFNMLPTLISKAPILYHKISSGIQTNLTLDQVIRLAWLASQVSEENIKTGIIGPPLQVEIATSPDGTQSILVPVPDQIRLLRDEIFATGGPAAPSTAVNSGSDVPTAAPTQQGDPVELMRAENASVVVLNGTTTPGLAGATSELLRSDGMNITGEKNADRAYSVTTIRDYTGKPYTSSYLIQKLNLPDTRIVSSFDPNATVDIEVILGEDWAAQFQQMGE
ncbi:MAG: LCP family protein [Chloroflexi bacterium]|nr:LCP family protein [Chloroflexota bacterium]